MRSNKSWFGTFWFKTIVNQYFLFRPYAGKNHFLERSCGTFSSVLRSITISDFPSLSIPSFLLSKVAERPYHFLLSFLLRHAKLGNFSQGSITEPYFSNTYFSISCACAPLNICLLKHDFVISSINRSLISLIFPTKLPVADGL